MSIRTLQDSDTPVLLKLWHRRWGQLFPLDLDLWIQQTIGDPEHYRPDLCGVLELQGQAIAFIGIKTPPPQPAWHLQDPKRAWISYLLIEPGKEQEGKELLQHSLSRLQDLGYSKVAYGSDPSHFFPGVPEDAALEALLKQVGFEVGKLDQDFHRFLADYQLPPKAREDLEKSGLQIVPCTYADVPALLAFLSEAFPGRWYYETLRRLQLGDTSDVLILKSQDEVFGFCQLYHKASKRRGPGIYWRRLLGSNYGGIGTVGLSNKVRGKGLGLALTAYGIQHLEDLGVEQMVIDWTTLADFYRKLGFEGWRSYRAYWKNFP